MDKNDISLYSPRWDLNCWKNALSLIFHFLPLWYLFRAKVRQFGYLICAFLISMQLLSLIYEVSYEYPEFVQLDIVLCYFFIAKLLILLTVTTLDALLSNFFTMLSFITFLKNHT